MTFLDRYPIQSVRRAGPALVNQIDSAGPAPAVRLPCACTRINRLLYMNGTLPPIVPSPAPSIFLPLPVPAIDFNLEIAHRVLRQSPFGIKAT